MKAAVITDFAAPPAYAEFREPEAAGDSEIVSVTAAGLSQLAKARAAGKHYSSSKTLPAVAGVDGVGRLPDGRRVYFVLPDPPFGAMAERVAVRADQCAMVPQGLDDVTAAAIANPGMSSWAALCERAHLVPGETVLINGATGTSGRLAVRIAKHLGAKKVVALGRNAAALRACVALGADETISLLEPPDALHAALADQFRAGVDVVVDYLYGESAAQIIAAVEDGDPRRAVRFVQVGSASGGTISLPAHALRATGLSLLGSGIGSVAVKALLRSIEGVFAAAAQGVLSIETRVEPLRAVAAAWQAAEGTARTVFTV